MTTFKLFLAGASVLALSTSVNATDLEVTHWWTSGGEAAAVAEFAKAFDATTNPVDGSQNHWVDGAIAVRSAVSAGAERDRRERPPPPRP